MKKRMMIVLFAGILAMGLMACNNSKAKPAEETKEEQEEQVKEETKEEEPEKQETETSEEQQVPEQPVQSEEPVVTEVKATIYYCNADATGFDKSEEVLTEVSAAELIKALSAKGVLPGDVTVLSCKQLQEGSKKLIDLDLSEGFSTYLMGQGTTGEYITVGSICNTFLDAYGSEGIRITVNGKILESGHAEYPGYLEHFQ